jgi:group I intron endonuclease
MIALGRFNRAQAEAYAAKCSRIVTARSSPVKQQRGWIYELVFPSGKSYVGKTVSWKRRMRGHRGAWRTEDGHVVKRAIKKYGWDSVVVKPLAKNVPKHNLSDAERFFIRARGTLSPGGYNLTEGGDAQPMDNPEVRAWQKKRIGESMRSESVRAKKRANWQDDEYRSMQYKARTGSVVWMQARKDCQNTDVVNEKRRQGWACKREAKLRQMNEKDGRYFMYRCKKNAVEAAHRAAKRIAGHSSRDPVAETHIFYDAEIARYEATIWNAPDPLASC